MVFCMCLVFVFFFKQKTAYEMRISDWSSDVCSSDLTAGGGDGHGEQRRADEGPACRPLHVSAPGGRSAPRSIARACSPASRRAGSPALASGGDRKSVV